MADRPSMILAKGWMTMAHGMWIMTFHLCASAEPTKDDAPRLTVVDLLE